jgi:CBS domain-containing protein
MGARDIQDAVDSESLRAFMRALLADVRALEQMIVSGRIETGVRRIGAEQEMFLVDRGMSPTNKALAILERLGTPGSFTTELGLFNLEANLTPRELHGDCLRALQTELEELLARARREAEVEKSRVVLTGILPTLEKRHLTLDWMTPIPRFYQLNQIMRELRGGEFRTLIKGLDELQITHDNVMLEACNTSFQLHYQVGPREFAHKYNLAQLVTAPVLAAGVNSPVLLRHRLWHETRVALFQQSVDTRSEAHAQRGGRVRVNFGDHWIEDSILEIFREDVARYRVLIATELEESPLVRLARGEAPELKALRLHNGTIYRWNRPCYGIGANGKPHLRIEMRCLPAGPSVADEIANAALFYGLMLQLAEEIPDVTRVMEFDDARENFVAAARYGLNARLRWLGQRVWGADELLLQELLPRARRGLERCEIDRDDVERSLGVLEERLRTRRTGAQWMLDSLEGMGGSSRADESYRALTAAMLANQEQGLPVARWELARADGVGSLREAYRTVGQVMTTDLFTVHPEDLVDLAASVMDWEHLRHVPVEDHEGGLVGLITHRHLLRMVWQGMAERGRPVAVREIMTPDPVTVGPETSTTEAVELMRAHKVGCLPVVREGKLVGIVTESDFLDLAGRLLERWLSEEP